MASITTPRHAQGNGAAGCWATTTLRPWARPATSPPTCACWGTWRLPGICTTTPWHSAAECWATTTPTPCLGSNFAADLRVLGTLEAARDLHHDTLERRRRVLGDDHPDTLASASNLAIDVRLLGQAADDGES